MKALRVLSGVEIVGESTAVDGLHQMTGLMMGTRPDLPRGKGTFD